MSDKVRCALLFLVLSGLRVRGAVEVKVLDKLFGPPNLIVPSVQTPQKIDGLLDDKEWKSAPKASMVLNNGRGKPERPTYLRLLSDPRSLYIAVYCEESRMEALRASVTETDGPLWTDDSVEFFFDPGHKENFDYSHIIINPL